MSDVGETSVGRGRGLRALHRVALAAALAVSAPAWTLSAQDYAYPADIDCNDPYYASYCLEYAAWLNQYYAAYGYPYNYWFGYPFVVVGIGFFHGHRFHNFHHFVVAHGIRFHGGFHGGAFHGGGFHGGGHR
jgi:hypothetical protein